MTIPASKIAPEPDRTGEIAINTLLDLVERQIETLCDLGAEAPLRARLARLLPAPVEVAAQPGLETALDWSALLAALRVVGSRRLAEADHLLVLRAKQAVQGAMAAALAAEKGEGRS